MKRISLAILSVAAVAAIATGCNNASNNGAETAPATVDSLAVAAPGSIVYFDLGVIMEKYNMAIDLRAEAEAKANEIGKAVEDMRIKTENEIKARETKIKNEIEPKGKKLQQDAAEFQEKIQKGLMTSTTAQIQQENILKRQDELQQLAAQREQEFNQFAAEKQQAYAEFAARKQQEISEELNVRQNQIDVAVKAFLDEFNQEHKYALILVSQGGNLPIPVAASDPSLDITAALLEGLNAAYKK